MRDIVIHSFFKYIVNNEVLTAQMRFLFVWVIFPMNISEFLLRLTLTQVSVSNDKLINAWFIVRENTVDTTPMWQLSLCCLFHWLINLLTNWYKPNWSGSKMVESLGRVLSTISKPTFAVVFLTPMATLVTNFYRMSQLQFYKPHQLFRSITYYNMTVWILAGNYISFTIAAGLIRLHMPGVKKSRV